MTSTLTAIGASDDRPKRPTPPEILFGDTSPLVLAQVKVARIVTVIEVLNNKVNRLETENTELKARVGQLEENAEENERSISVLQDTVAEIQSREEKAISLRTLRPNRSQQRQGLGHK